MFCIIFQCFQANDKILDESKLKVFADDNLNEAKMTIYVFDRARKIVGKGENVGNQHFLLLPQCFKKSPFLSRNCVVKDWKKRNFFKNICNCLIPKNFHCISLQSYIYVYKINTEKVGQF